MTVNIYVLISPSGIYNAELQILQHSPEGRKILINLSGVDLKSNLWDQEINANKDFTFSSVHSRFFKKGLFQVKRAIIVKRLFKQVFQILKAGSFEKVVLFFQNLEEPLTNRLFFYNWNVGFEGNIIEDGIANYYDCYKVYPERKKDLVKKKIFLAFLFFKFRIPETLTGISYDVVKHQFVKKPDLAFKPEKSLALKVKENKYSVVRDRILFIGQESYVNFFSEEYYNLRLQAVIVELGLRFPQAQLFYKRHYNSDVFIDLGNNFKEIKDSKRVEFVVSKLCPEVIISFTSSALLNLAIEYHTEMSNKNLKLFYVGGFNCPDNVILLFEKLGIEYFNLTH
jgi:hypothetical protein